MALILAGDVGGTKTDLAIFSTEAGPRAPLTHAEFHSRSYPSLDAILRDFLAQLRLTVDRACIDVAGPMLDGTARVTNLPWTIDAASLRRELGLHEVELVNDLEATAWAVPLLGPDDVRTLNAGEPAVKGAIGVVAPGTGLGEAFLVWTGSGYKACASEGGHADFAPADDIQAELLQYLWRDCEHVSFERVCSGIAIPSIYKFLRDEGYQPESEEFSVRLQGADDETHTIIDAALHAGQPDPLCSATVDLFASILGAEAGNLALKVLATGGIYLAGGIPMHALAALEKPSFFAAFQQKGRFSDLVARIPLHVITCQVALIGAAAHGIESARRAEERLTANGRGN
jgi:glucokinase